MHFYLKQFISILKKEQKALIQNKNEKIEAIVKQKEEFVAVFESFEPVDSPEIKQLILEIKELQTTNLMLTEQAIQYNDAFLSAVVKESKKTQSTYSADGKYTQQKDVSFIEQSF